MKALKMSVAVLVCSCFLSFWGTGGGRACATETVIAFGDSITAGWPYQTYNGNGCTGCGGYESFLQYFFDSVGRDVTVYNYGVPGEMTGDALNRIDSVLASTSPDFLLLMEGTNDLTFYTDSATVSYNLYWMAWKAVMYGAKPIVATITPDTRFGVDWKGVNVTNEWIRSYVGSASWICLSDQNSGIKDYWDYGYNYDGLHPNWWGYWVMAATWYNDIQTLQQCTY